MLNDIFNKWLGAQKYRYSKNTITAYTFDFASFEMFLKDYLNVKNITLAMLQKLTLSDIRGWLAFRLQKGNTHRSNARAVSSMRTFFQYLCDDEGLKQNLFYQLSPQKINKNIPRPLDEKGVIRFLEQTETAHKERWLGLRDKALFSLIYACGLRISEALQLNHEDIDVSQILIHGKGGKTRYVPLLPIVQSCFSRYLSETPHICKTGSPLFFSKTGKRMRSVEAAAIIAHYRKLNNLPDSLTPHAFRHSCATHLVKKTNDLRAVQELLGHASLSTTQVYTELDEEYLMNTYNKIKPRQ